MPGTINLASKAGEVTGPRDEPTNILFLNRHSISNCPLNTLFDLVREV